MEVMEAVLELFDAVMEAGDLLAVALGVELEGDEQILYDAEKYRDGPPLGPRVVDREGLEEAANRPRGDGLGDTGLGI